jgi:hypothetical protein
MAAPSQSSQFVHVPFIGYENVISVLDNDSGNTEKFVADYTGAGDLFWVPKSSTGDEGNLPAGAATVDSYTDKDPNGRPGNMITHMELIGEGADADSEEPNFLTLVAIPAGLAAGAQSPLLDKKYSLSNQPPAESFDYSKFLPLVCAKPCLSLYGGALAGSYSGYEAPTTRFPTVPTAEPFEGAATSGVLFYLPPGFYGNINTILNDLIGGTDAFNITLVDQPQYGRLLALGRQLRT